MQPDCHQASSGLSQIRQQGIGRGSHSQEYPPKQTALHMGHTLAELLSMRSERGSRQTRQLRKQLLTVLGKSCSSAMTALRCWRQGNRALT